MNLTRFAPTPNGPLHLGHFFNLMVIHALSEKYQLKKVLRAENRDPQRCSGENLRALDSCLSQLEELGSFPIRLKNQSERTDRYAYVAKILQTKNLLFACTCSRKQLQNHVENQTTAVCTACKRKNLPLEAKDVRWRFSAGFGSVADGVLIRNKDKIFSFEFTSIVDDYDDKITHVIRGADLKPLQIKLGTLRKAVFPDAPELKYFYHPVLYENKSQKLSKSKDSSSLARMLETGWTIDLLIGYCGFLLGYQNTLQKRSLSWWVVNGPQKLLQ